MVSQVPLRTPKEEHTAVLVAPKNLVTQLTHTQEGQWTTLQLLVYIARLTEEPVGLIEIIFILGSK